MIHILELFSRLFFLLGISYYTITLLQWYSYNPLRVITKHHKWRWHLLYFVLPIVVFFALFALGFGVVFYAYLYLVYLPMLIMWAFRLDKRIVFTPRVWRFFGIIAIFAVLNEAIFIGFDATSLYYLWLMPFIFGAFICEIYEAILLRNFTALAKDKLAMMHNLKIIMITASFGKTSIKNFLAQILEGQYNLHFTPRSINTFKGIVADINNNLAFGTDIYIAEAGARMQGDIREIATLLHPQIGVIGEIGNAHIEYFKSLESIVKTKFELLESNRLQKIFVYEKNTLPNDIDSSKQALIQTYPLSLRNIETTLESTRFEMKLDGEWVEFETYILGRFNVDNIAVAVMVAHYLGMKVTTIQKLVKKLSPIPHRFNLSISNGKTIIDDGFNGNINGMLEGIRLCNLYQGRKVIVTPGLIESDKESNHKLARAIDEVFDLAIVTGERNSDIMAEALQHTQRVILKDKTQLENVLKGLVNNGDLVYFANDAPSYI